MHAFGMGAAGEPGKPNASLSLASMWEQLFHDLLSPRYPATEPLDLASIRNMGLTLKITHEDAQAKLAELADHFERLKTLASLQIYWFGNYKDDALKNELFPRLLAEHKGCIESTTRAFANYMAMQALAVQDIEEKYAKELATVAPAPRRFVGPPDC